MLAMLKTPDIRKLLQLNEDEKEQLTQFCCGASGVFLKADFYRALHCYQNHLWTLEEKPVEEPVEEPVVEVEVVQPVEVAKRKHKRKLKEVKEDRTRKIEEVFEPEEITVGEYELKEIAKMASLRLEASDLDAESEESTEEQPELESVVSEKKKKIKKRKRKEKVPKEKKKKRKQKEKPPKEEKIKKRKPKPEAPESDESKLQQVSQCREQHFDLIR